MTTLLTFKPVSSTPYNLVHAEKRSRDFSYWRVLNRHSIDHHVSVSSITVCPISTVYEAAVITPSHVLVVDYKLKDKVHALSISSHLGGSCCAYRPSDGALLAVGDNGGGITVFNRLDRYKQLRHMAGCHSAAIKCISFCPVNKQELMCCGDDFSLTIWNIATEDRISSSTHHKDFLRTLDCHPINQNHIATGSYDKMVKIFDRDTGSVVKEMQCETLIECVLFDKNGSKIAAASSNIIEIFDFDSSKSIGKLMQHHKTVTMLCNSSEKTKFVSSSLDKRLKVWNWENMECVATISCDDSIIGLAIAPQYNSCILTVLSNKQISLLFRATRRMKDEVRHIATNLDDINVKPQSQLGDFVSTTAKSKSQASGGDRRLQIFEPLLRKYRYAACLDLLFDPSSADMRLDSRCAVLMELARLDKLKVAASGRKLDQVLVYLGFISNNIHNYCHQPMLIEFANVLLTVYEEEFITSQDKNVTNSFELVRSSIERELTIKSDLHQFMGVLDCLIAQEHSC